MRKRTLHVGLLDHMGGGNLGDDTTQTAMIQEITRRWPNAVIVGFSMNPPDTEARHGIQAFPIRRMTWNNPAQQPNAPAGSDPATSWRRAIGQRARRLPALALRKPKTVLAELGFLAGSLRIMRSIDVFVISGGGQLLDSWGGPWAYPWTIFKWVALSRLAGTQCYFVNVGAGPLASRLSRQLIRQALSMANYVAFRDQGSKALARRIGFTGTAEVGPDNVYAIATATIRQSAARTTNRSIVGLSPMAWCDPRRYWQQDQTRHDRFLSKFVAFASKLAAERQVQLFSTDIWFDAQTLQRVQREVAAAADDGQLRLLGPDCIHSLDSLLAAMAAMDHIVTCRFHGVIFAHLMRIPVIALSHHPKVTTLMADLGLSEYCLDIESFSLDQLEDAFGRLVTNSPAIRHRMHATAMRYRQALTEQFDRLFQPEFAR